MIRHLKKHINNKIIIKEKEYAMKTKNFLTGAKDGDMFQGVARILSRRKMGKICFCDARFKEHQVQVIFSKELENYQEVSSLPLGSLLHLSGKKRVTSSGTPSLDVTEAKTLFVYQDFFPDKHHGLSQVRRYHERYVDFMINKESFLFAKKMSKSLQVIRNVLYEKSFHEFITGVLQENFEAGQAHAFTTSCRANNKDYSLSLTSELKLKRLLVAGFERVFEISQSFRNEGIDSIHSPEFTMLEVYEVNSNVYQMMNLLEEITYQVVLSNEGSESLEYYTNGKKEVVSYKKPFKRLSFKQAFTEVIGPYDWCNLQKMISIYPNSFNTDMTTFTWLMKVIEKFIVPTIKEPTFLTKLPTGMSPFVKNKNQEITERSFLIAQKTFLADIYTDENDAFILSESLKRQATEIGSEVNSEYLKMVKAGLPQTAGIGLGLNRLFMLMLGVLPYNIKETILYPIF